MNLQWTDEDLHVGINYYLTKPFTSEPSCHVKLFKNNSISWLFSSILFELNLSKSRPSHQKYHYPLSWSMFLNQYILYMPLYENLSSWRQRHPPSLYCNLLILDLRKAPIRSCCLFVLRNKARLVREDCQDTPLLLQLQATYGSPCVTDLRLLTLSISFCV